MQKIVEFLDLISPFLSVIFIGLIIAYVATHL